MHHNYFILFQFLFFCPRLQRPNELEKFGQNTANNVALAIAKMCTYCYLATLFCTLFSPCLCPSKLLPLLNSISKWDWTHVKMSLQIFSASHSWSQFQFLLCNSDFFFWSLKPVHTKNRKWDKKNSFWIAETGPIWFSLSTFQAQCKAKGNNCLKVFPGNAKMKLTFRSNFIFSLLLCCTEWGLLLTWQNKAKIRHIFNRGFLIY